MTRDLQLALAPTKRIGSLFLLPDCDMSCRFCASDTHFSVMSFERARALLLALGASAIESVVLGGGEPFLWPHDLARLGGVARQAGHCVQVCTNGVKLPDGFETLDWVDRYILPLEAMDPALHNSLRRSGGDHHALMLERLRALACSGREVTISTVVNRENVAELPRIADHLTRASDRGLVVHAWHLYRFLPVGRGGERNANDLCISHADYRHACAHVKSRELDFAVYRRSDMLRSRSVEFFWYEGRALKIGSRDLMSDA